MMFLIMCLSKYLLRKFGDTKGQSEKDIQYNGQRLKKNRTNNDLHNITHKTKDWATRILHKNR
jgi:hypothetical protein